MPSRRAFIAGVAAGALACAAVTRVSAADRQYRIGWLREGSVPISDTFWTAMRSRGLALEKDLLVVPRFAHGIDQLPALAKELVELDVDVIITDGTPATLAAKNATARIPIVFAIGADPVARGLVASLARPGGNLTGFTFGAYDDKQLQVITEALPQARIVVYPLRDPSNSIVTAASVLGVRVIGISAPGPEAIPDFFAGARAAKADAVVFANVAWAGPHEARIVSEALKRRIPLIATWPSFAKAGALMSYGPNQNAYWLTLATQVDKILRGASVSDLPVEGPNVFTLVVNLKTAKALNVTIPRSVLLRADEVIR